MKIKWPKSITIRAALIGGFFVIMAAIITVIGTIIFNNINNEYESIPSEVLFVSKVRPIIDQQTKILDSFTFIKGKGTLKTGILSVFWEVLLSNNGINNLSVIRYDISQINKQFVEISYTNMEQGVFTLEDGALIPINLPISIKSGDSMVLFFRIGIIMDANAFQLVKSEYADHKNITLNTIINFLRQKKMDFYGNPFSVDDIGVYSLPPIDELKEQVFGINFETSRSTKAVGILSWYKYGLYLNAVR